MSTSFFCQTSRKISDRRRKLLSNKKMKGISRLKSATAPTINLKTLMLIHTEWNLYAQRLMSLSSNDNQLQSRFNGAEVTGSLVIVLQSSRSRIIGKYGIITSSTESTIDIAIVDIEKILAWQTIGVPVDVATQDCYDIQRLCITKLLRVHQVLGIMLPSALKGSKLYEYKKVAIIKS